MRTRPIALSTIPVILGIIFACSINPPPYCPHGSFPMDGATGVALDTTIVLSTSGLPRDVPSLQDAVGLETARGRPVEVEVEVDGDTIILRPAQPLQPETTYLVWGISVEEERWWGALVDDYGEFTFTTGGTPQLLASTPGYDEGTLWLAFSEPVDPESLDGALSFPSDQPYTVVGLAEGTETIVEIAVELATSDTLSLLEGAKSLRGPGVQPAEATPGAYPAWNATELHNLHTNQPYCTLR